MKRRMFSLLLALCICLMVLPSTAFAAGTYNPGDIAVINGFIDNNSLALPKAPADGSSVPTEWLGIVGWSSDATNMRVERLYITFKSMTGTLDVSGLSSLKYLYCHDNLLTGVVLNSTAQYIAIDVRHNRLADTSAITGQSISWDIQSYFPFTPQLNKDSVITYDSNGGSGSMPDNHIYRGRPFKLPANGFTAPTGQRFITWAIGDLGTGERVNPGDTYSFTGDTTVYPIWEVIMIQETPTWTQDSDQSPATFTSSADINDFLEVWFNDGTTNRLLTQNVDYTVSEGSTIITFTTAFLNSLSPGNYSVEIASTKGSAFGTLEIKDRTTGQVTPLGQSKTTKVPRTGDNMRIYLWSGLLLFAVGGLAILLLRKSSNQKSR
jgi:LPXTG-motif cell wall-anchored protein